MKYNSNEVRCAECGTNNDAGNEQCEYCDTKFTHKSRYRIKCYYCPNQMDHMWGRDKELNKHTIVYMLCDECSAKESDVTIIEGENNEQ